MSVENIRTDVLNAVQEAQTAPIAGARESVESVDIANVKRLLGELTTALYAIRNNTARVQELPIQVTKSGSHACFLLGPLDEVSNDSAITDLKDDAVRLNHGGGAITADLAGIYQESEKILRGLHQVSPGVSVMEFMQQQALETADSLAPIPDKMQRTAEAYLGRIGAL
jgi:hypothetical protein